MAANMKKKTQHIVHIIPFLQHGAGRAVVNVIRGLGERGGRRQTLRPRRTSNATSSPEFSNEMRTRWP